MGPSTEKDARRDVRLVSGDALQAALYSVDAVHQFHGDACLCGFKSPRSRSRTEHITTEVMVALARVTSPDVSNPAPAPLTTNETREDT